MEETPLEREIDLIKILVTHNNDLLHNFYSLEAVRQLKEFAEVRINGTNEPLFGDRLVEAARDVDIVISDRLAPGSAEEFEQAFADAVAISGPSLIDVDITGFEPMRIVPQSPSSPTAVADSSATSHRTPRSVSSASGPAKHRVSGW